jgi:hypothetical protein
MQELYQTGSDILQSRSWEQDQAPWEVTDDPLLETVYEGNAPIILEDHQESSVSSSYNVPLSNDYISSQRPATKWKPYLITNVWFVLYHLNYPLGNAVQLPDYILKSKSIVALDKNVHNQKHYKDHLCAFRCLAVHRGHLRDRLETHTRALFDRWVQFANEKHLDVGRNPMQYQGLPLHQISRDVFPSM